MAKHWYRHIANIHGKTGTDIGGGNIGITKGTSLFRKVEVPEPADPVNVGIELI